jgi:membrane-bound transcription factor site-1 protease
MRFPTNKTLDQATFRLIFDYIPTPPRHRRILFDQYHSLKYPENGYILRDSLLNAEYPYEWNGDHLFTNFVTLHQKLTSGESNGFFIEILNERFSCFNANNYKVLMIVDPEDYMAREEIEKLRDDFEN